MRCYLTFLSALILLVFAACGAPDASTPAPSAETPAAAEPPAADPAPADPAAAEPPAASDDAPLVVFLGDSLTAGYGLDELQAFPALVGETLTAEGLPIRVVNAGVSGDTTAGGLTRLSWVLRQKPDVLVVGLGGNDGLRGLDLEMSEGNLRQIIEKGREAGAKVLLLGMLIPPNYGPDYTQQFAAVYQELAAELGVALVPFLLEGVGGVPELNQADGIHPTAEGQRLVAGNVVPYLRSLLGADS